MNSLYEITAKKIFNLTKYLKENLTDIDNDVENLHQARVASRRIRAALPVLRDKMEKNKYKELLGGIKGVTKSFGPARDLDVQILYLEEAVKTFPGIGVLLEDRRLRRAKLEADIEEATDRIRAGSLLKEIKMECRGIISKKYEHSDSDFFKAYSEILLRMKPVMNLESTLSDPKNQAGHHMLRIAIKKLRYSLENFMPLYREELDPVITNIKKLQTILGDIHDLDVWSTLLRKILSGEEKLEAKEPFDINEARKSIECFTSKLIQKRELTFENLLSEWDKLKKKGFFEDILKVMSSKLPLPDFFTRDNNTVDFGGLTHGEAENLFLSKKLEDYGINLTHSKNVAEISLELFDKLKKLHKLGELERRYLKFGAALHDIGWSIGTTAHHKGSMKLIMEDGGLPFNTYERLIVGNIARYHRNWIKESHWNFKILDQNSKEIVKKLSALLRLGDAMDLEGEYAYKNFDLEICNNKVKLTLPEKPVQPVLDRIAKKKDLFEQAYGKKLEVYY